MSSVAENDPQREITQGERQDFVNAVERLDQHMQPWSPNVDKAAEELHGPRDQWPEHVREEWRRMREEMGGFIFALFDIRGSKLHVAKDKFSSSIGDLIDDGTTEEALVKEVKSIVLKQGSIRWLATSYVQGLNGTMLSTNEHVVSQTSNLPFGATFNTTQAFLAQDVGYEPVVSDEERELIDKDREQQQGLGLLELTPAFWERLNLLKSQREAATELEELTGILPHLFTKERFDAIMPMLALAGSGNLISH